MTSSIEDLATLWPSARFSSTVADFYASALRLQFGAFAVETILSSSYTCTRDERLIERFPRPAIAIEVILEGSVQRQQQSLDYVQTAGEAAVTMLDVPFSFTWTGPGRSVRTVAALPLLPAEFRRSDAIRSGPLADSPLVSAYIGFVRSLVDVAQPAAAENRPLEVAALSLHRAVLVEALTPRPAPRDLLRSQIDQHIDEHLSDPTLSPTRIATDLGVSVRSIHNAFNKAGLTVAAEIRRRRVLVAAALLPSSTPGTPTLAAIIQEVGFSSIEQLRRSFISVLGVTPSEYQRRRPTN